MRKHLASTMLVSCLATGGVWAADEMAQKDAPELPPGVAPKVLDDQEDQRSVLAAATDAALLKGGFDDLVERLATPDRNRLEEFADRNLPDLDGRIDQIRRNWATKYGDEFDITESMLANHIVIRGGEITAPETVVEHWPVAPTGKTKAIAPNGEDTLKYLDRGREVAILQISGHDMPTVNVSMVHEAIDDWRIDVPDDVTGQQIYSSLLGALTKFGDNVASWPATADEAYRLVNHDVMLSLYNVPVEGGGRMAGERSEPQQPMPAP